jgi:membrane glycosyltransferase
MTDLPITAVTPLTAGLTGRRVFFATVVFATTAGLLALAAAALSPDGLDGLDLALLVLFAITLPWTVVGFWNAAIGFLIMRFARDPVAQVFPAAVTVNNKAPITASVAILCCIRNEAPDLVLRNLATLVEGLTQSSGVERFHLYLLSDTGEAFATAEAKRFDEFAQAWNDRIAVTYRRRTNNDGFKAGNIRGFCERWGDQHDVAITLDADSVMPAEAVLRLVRLMQAQPTLGIVQALVIGLPAAGTFSRIFQFGMRLGMRSYTIGSAWWQGDCGPYWGHNAALRLRPFIAHCLLPKLPGGADVLSHDQIEAVLMRRAGYEVRALPREDLGWEENPPNLVEFIRRDLRWCQGNMQYWRFLTMPGLLPISRYQLAFAMLMFIGSPAWIGLLVLGTIAALATNGHFVDPHYAWPLLAVTLFMWFAPKVATVTDNLTRAPTRIAYGGAVRFLAGVLMETIFFILLSPIQWMSHTIMLARLIFGRPVGWAGQLRHDHAVPFGQACRRFWPHTLLGLAALIALAATHPTAVPVAMLIAGGLALSIPLAVITSSPAINRLMLGAGLCRLPEETAPPEILRELALPALKYQSHG